MATTNYLPDRILLRNDLVNNSLNWNSTDSESHWRKNKHRIDSKYSDTNVKYTFNEMGYRTHPFDTIEKDFILCMGCSYTEGIGVDDADTWPAKLEKAAGMQAINLGMGGCSTQSIMINSTQWIRSGMPKPSAVVIQIPEVTREPCAHLKSALAHHINPWGLNKDQSNNPEAQRGLDSNPSVSTIFMDCTRPNYDPGTIVDQDYYSKWRNYRDKFEAHIINPVTYGKEPEITPWFMTSMQMTTTQTMWNAVGVPVLQMTYDDDGDTIYNPNNVFRITGEYVVDFGRDLCHNGPATNQLIVNNIWPEIQELLEQPPYRLDQRISGEHPVRQRRDIRRLPWDRRHSTMGEARAKLQQMDTKKGGPFIYE